MQRYRAVHRGIDGVADTEHAAEYLRDCLAHIGIGEIQHEDPGPAAGECGARGLLRADHHLGWRLVGGPANGAVHPRGGRQVGGTLRQRVQLRRTQAVTARQRQQRQKGNATGQTGLPESNQTGLPESNQTGLPESEVTHGLGALRAAPPGSGPLA